MHIYFLGKIYLFLYLHVIISADGSQELFLSYYRYRVRIMDQSKQKLAAEARNAYARKWRAANPDKVRVNNMNYRLRRAAKENTQREVEEKRKDDKDG